MRGDAIVQFCGFHIFFWNEPIDPRGQAVCVHGNLRSVVGSALPGRSHRRWSVRCGATRVQSTVQGRGCPNLLESTSWVRPKNDKDRVCPEKWTKMNKNELNRVDDNPEKNENPSATLIYKIYKLRPKSWINSYSSSCEIKLWINSVSS
jgi:hypothetical protein